MFPAAACHRSNARASWVEANYRTLPKLDLVPVRAGCSIGVKGHRRFRHSWEAAAIMRLLTMARQIQQELVRSVAVCLAVAAPVAVVTLFAATSVRAYMWHIRHGDSIIFAQWRVPIPKAYFEAGADSFFRHSFGSPFWKAAPWGHIGLSLIPLTLPPVPYDKSKLPQNELPQKMAINFGYGVGFRAHPTIATVLSFHESRTRRGFTYAA